MNDIIDVHAHACLDGHTCLDGQPFKTMEEIIRVAKEFEVDKLCLLGYGLRFGHNPTEAEIKIINDLTIKLVRKWPEILIGFCFLNPRHRTKFIFAEMERCLVRERLKGLGEIEIAVNARDKRMDPIMKKAEELDVVVLQHSWDTSVIGRKMKGGGYQSDPSDIADLASRFPKTKIIMAHLTAAGYRGILDVQPFPNVYVDTSGSQPFSEIIEYAVKELGAERILFGSDVPGRDFSAQLARIYDARISSKEKKLILGLNAKKLLKLN